jgi:hypothetical protein
MEECLKQYDDFMKEYNKQHTKCGDKHSAHNRIPSIEVIPNK